MKRIAVLTSGGDSPGMNAAVRAVVRYGIANSVQVFGVRQGYLGLLEGRFEEMNSRSVGGIIRTGGTILQTARCEEFLEDWGQKKALANLEERGIDGLVVIGGDGSLRGALALHKLGYPTVGIPASIDNDISHTELSIGTDTALNTILDALDKIKDTASSHRRAFIIEVMGRRHGYLALAAGIAGGAEWIVLPNAKIEPEKIAQDVHDAFSRGKPHYIIILAEGANFDGKTGSEDIKNALLASGIEPRVTVLGHVQRGGSPTLTDRLLGTRLGAAAAKEVIEGKSGVMAALQGNSIVSVCLETVLSSSPSLDPNLLQIAEPMAK